MSDRRGGPAPAGRQGSDGVSGRAARRTAPGQTIHSGRRFGPDCHRYDPAVIEESPVPDARGWAFDAVLAGFLLVLGVVEELFFPYTTTDQIPYLDPDLFGYLLLLLGTVPLAWRRRYPIEVYLISGVGFFGRLLVGYALVTAVQMSALLAIYTLGAYGRRPTAVTVRSVSLPFVLGLFGWAVALARFPLIVLGIMVLVWGAVAVFGETVHIRRRYQAALEERAARLEAERDERVRRAVELERSRIARELHDVWAHTVSMIVVQAGAAEEVFEDSPEFAREALASIRLAGRRALSEVRRLVATDADVGPDLAPAASLADLDRLAEDYRAAGLPVTVTVSGTVVDLPPDIGLSAYRILQQALTNTLTHAGPDAAATVDIVRLPDELTLDVADNGIGAVVPVDPRHGGQGLIGMRERVALFEGVLEAGPRPGGGFSVHARIPLGGDE